MWLLPVFICMGMLRANVVQGDCEQELKAGLDGRGVQVTGTVAEIARKNDWTVLTLECVRVQTTYGDRELGVLGRALLYLEQDSEIHIGNQIRARGECSFFEPARNPGEFDYRLYYRSLKLNYRMFVRSYEVENADRYRCRDWLYRLSVRAGAQFERLTGPEHAGVFRALILGDRTVLQEEIRSLYQKNGIAHLLAVSGLHLSLVSLSIYGLLRKSGAGYGKAGLIGGVVLLAYAVLTGASPSVVRALVMISCGFLAAYLGRTYDLLSALGLSALLMFWNSPYLLCQAGVQLSFGAVFSIGALAAWGSPEIRRNGFYISAALQLVTLPIVLYHFFQYPLYGAVLNLLVLPLIGIVIGSGSAALLLSAGSLMAGRFVIGGGCMVLEWYEYCCHLFERLPGSSFLAGRPDLWRIGGYYGLLIVLLLHMGNRQEEENERRMPGRWRGNVRMNRPIYSAVLLSAMSMLLLLRPVHGLQVTFLDVGQGDGICLQTEASVVLVDGGSTDEKNLGENRLEPFLKSKGIRVIDCAIVSHGDLDHTSGLVYLLESCEDIRIRQLVLPAIGEGDESYVNLQRLAEKRGTLVSWMEVGDRAEYGALQLNCIWPEGESADGKPPEDRNEHSLVLRADYGSFHMLLTGDMSGEGEAMLLRKRETLSDIQVLKAAHHGSRFSSTEEFLVEVRPQITVISAGADNRYHHPHEEAVERLKAAGSQIWCTQETGAVLLETDGKRMKMKSFLAGAFLLNGNPV